MYAELCARLDKLQQSGKFPTTEITDDEGKVVPLTFKKMLVNACEHRFTERPSPQPIPDDVTDPEKRSELEMKNTKIREQNLGLIQFIGELAKLKLLGERIMRYCLLSLLQQGDDESLEHFCVLMTTIGSRLDSSVVEETKETMKQIFEHLQKIVKDTSLAPRTRFLILDVLDLKANRWQPRHASEGPKKLAEVAADVERQERRKEQMLRESQRKGYQTRTFTLPFSLLASADL